MGVNTFILDRRTVSVLIGGRRQKVATLRRYFKITELDASRTTELKAAERIKPSPAAAMVMDVLEIPLATAPEKPIAAYLVLGWEEGRGSVTDFGWDFLPELGYAVRDPETHEYALFELRDGVLYSIEASRAAALGLTDNQGLLVRRGQPIITDCGNVRPYIDGYANADCTLSTGARTNLITAIEGNNMPTPEWFIGKTPRQVAEYKADRPSPAL